ncbi:L-amino acid N-acyltransferase YncA [Catalinimonas alkaloidigena]|uniref:L-amino acid N-acyltransferase YncA n=1 Tax=Catalinimonas alkaloidigena TaxID=1075417 RepID=A0A1G9AP10_9BACT|nr:GNAT family N-acetyltransferase [Catalinimonas alkaloidigena]SDK29048.1 L-amino acid N-acyltransferase YncA [Catalinimonas alkaloidigena]
MNHSNGILIRQGEEKDIDAVYQLVEELAIYHKHDPNYIINSPEQMREDAFGENRYFRFFVAEENGHIVGATIYYYIYSTWKGKSLYLEDLIITESHRGRGIGKLFMQALAHQAVKNGASKMKWQVAEDNASAIRFYERVAADFDPEWINCELNREQLESLSGLSILSA